MKKIMKLCLAFIVVFSLAGCGSNDNEETPEKTEDTEKSVTIDEQVLFDENGVKISVYGEITKDNSGNYVIPMKLVNTNKDDAEVSIYKDCSINGMMSAANFYQELKANESKEAELLIEEIKIKDKLLEIEPKNITVNISAYADGENIEKLVSFTTNSEKDPEMLMEHFENVVADNEKVKVSAQVSQYAGSEDVIVDLVIENKTGKMLLFNNDQIIINDKIVSSAYADNILPESTIHTELQIYEDDLKNIETEIEDIKDIKVLMILRTFDTSEDLLDTNEFDIEVNEIKKYEY